MCDTCELVCRGTRERCECVVCQRFVAAAKPHARSQRNIQKKNATANRALAAGKESCARASWRAVFESSADERVVVIPFVVLARTSLVAERRAIVLLRGRVCFLIALTALAFSLCQTQMTSSTRRKKSSRVIIDRTMLFGGVMAIFVALAFVNNMALNVSVALHQYEAFNSSRCVMNEFSSSIVTVRGTECYMFERAFSSVSPLPTILVAWSVQVVRHDGRCC